VPVMATLTAAIHTSMAADSKARVTTVGSCGREHDDMREEAAIRRMNHVATDVRDGGATPRRLVRGLVLGLLGAGLLWAVGAHSLVAALAERNPVLALSLRSSDPLALLELAKRREQENAIGAERGADQWAVSISGDGLGVGD